MVDGWALTERPNSCFTAGRDKTTTVNTPRAVPKGKKAHCIHAMTKTNQYRRRERMNWPAAMTQAAKHSPRTKSAPPKIIKNHPIIAGGGPPCCDVGCGGARTKNRPNASE